MSASWKMTRAHDGDMRAIAPGSRARQTTFAAVPWTTTLQVHGANVVVVDGVLGTMDVDADAIVTAAHHVPIAMLGADCALIAFSSDEGVIGVAHAGWKGLVAGVIQETADALHALGAKEITAACSAMIHPECYEFSPNDLDEVATHLGAAVRGVTAQGRPALDLPAAVRDALGRAGVASVTSLGGCTACEGDWFSWRARHEEERHALVCWSSADA